MKKFVAWLGKRGLNPSLWLPQTEKKKVIKDWMPPRFFFFVDIDDEKIDVADCDHGLQIDWRARNDRWMNEPDE